MSKIKAWLFRSHTDLTKKWWHRMFKVLFIVSTVLYTFYICSFLIDSYPTIVNKWDFLEHLRTRLSVDEFKGKLVSLNEVLGEDEVIAENYKDLQQGWSIDDKDYIVPIGILGYQQGKSIVCSDQLEKSLIPFVAKEKIVFYSPIDYRIDNLYVGLPKFIDYINSPENNILCVATDSYTIENHDNTTSVYKFLKPIDTRDFYIYKYKFDIASFIYVILLSIASIVIVPFIVIITYYKIVLYIIYGNHNDNNKG